MTEDRYCIDADSRLHNSIVIFVRDAMPGEWRGCAHELRNAAELVWEGGGNQLRCEVYQHCEIIKGKLNQSTVSRKIFSESRPYILLASFALENIIKGYLVACDPSSINSGKLKKDLRTHELTKLCDKIKGLKLSKNEESFCKIAESAIPYWGRYPIPLAHNSVMPEVGIDKDLRNGFLSLFDRVDEMLYRMIRDGWDSGVGAKSGPMYDARYDSGDRLKLLRQQRLHDI